MPQPAVSKNEGAGQGAARSRLARLVDCQVSPAAGWQTLPHLDCADGNDATQLVDHQRRQRLARHILGNDQQRAVHARNLCEGSVGC